MKSLFLAIPILVSLMFLVSCNTWEGLKEDTKQAGRAVGGATESAGGALKKASE